MPSIHYRAEQINDALSLRPLKAPPPRLTKEERRSIRKMSGEMERLMSKWIEAVNSTGEWKTYYSKY